MDPIRSLWASINSGKKEVSLLALPLLQIKKLDSFRNWVPPRGGNWEKNGENGAIILISSQTTAECLESLPEESLKALKRCKISVFGKKTALALEKKGYSVCYEENVSGLEELISRVATKTDHLVYIGAKERAVDPAITLEKLGLNHLKVTTVDAYETLNVSSLDEHEGTEQRKRAEEVIDEKKNLLNSTQLQEIQKARNLLTEKDVHTKIISLFSSPSAVRALRSFAPPFFGTKQIAIGQTTASELKRLGYTPSVCKNPSIEELFKSAISEFRHVKK